MNRLRVLMGIGAMGQSAEEKLLFLELIGYFLLEFLNLIVKLFYDFLFASLQRW